MGHAMAPGVSVGVKEALTQKNLRIVAPKTPTTPVRVDAAVSGCPRGGLEGRRGDRSHARTPTMTEWTHATVPDVLPPVTGPGPVTG